MQVQLLDPSLTLSGSAIVEKSDVKTDYSSLFDDVLSLTEINDEEIVKLLQNRFSMRKNFTRLGPMLLATMSNGGESPTVDEDLDEYIASIVRQMLISQQPNRKYSLICIGENTDMKNSLVDLLYGDFITRYTKDKAFLSKLQKASDLLLLLGGHFTSLNVPSSDSQGSESAESSSFQCNYSRLIKLNMSRPQVDISISSALSVPFSIQSAQFLPYFFNTHHIIQSSSQDSNYMVFYLLFLLNKEELFLSSPSSSFAYLSQHPPPPSDMLQPYTEQLRDCVEQVFANGFQDSVELVYRCLSAVLHIGQIEYTNAAHHSNDPISLSNPEILSAITQLLNINIQELEDLLLFKVTSIRNEKFKRPYTLSQCIYVRDILAKRIYAQIVHYTVYIVNAVYLASSTSVREQEQYELSVVDVEGFTSTPYKLDQPVYHSFDALCSNYLNERLHSYNLINLLYKELLVYQEEDIFDIDIQIDSDADSGAVLIDYFSELKSSLQSPISNFIESTIFVLLQDMCKLQCHDSSLLAYNIYKYHTKYSDIVMNSTGHYIENSFTIRHYNHIEVGYNTVKWAEYYAYEQYIESINQALQTKCNNIVINHTHDLTLLSTSKIDTAANERKAIIEAPMLEELPAELSPTSKKINSINNRAASSNKINTKSTANSLNSKPIWVYRYKAQVDAFIGSLEDTQSYFVKCLTLESGREERKAEEYSREQLSSQVQGHELTKIAQFLADNYKVKLSFEEFNLHYGLFYPGLSRNSSNKAAVVNSLVDHLLAKSLDLSKAYHWYATRSKYLMHDKPIQVCSQILSKKYSIAIHNVSVSELLADELWIGKKAHVFLSQKLFYILELYHSIYSSYYKQIQGKSLYKHLAKKTMQRIKRRIVLIQNIYRCSQARKLLRSLQYQALLRAKGTVIAGFVNKYRLIYMEKIREYNAMRNRKAIMIQCRLRQIMSKQVLNSLREQKRRDLELLRDKIGSLREKATASRLYNESYEDEPISMEDEDGHVRSIKNILASINNYPVLSSAYSKEDEHLLHCIEKLLLVRKQYYELFILQQFNLPEIKRTLSEFIKIFKQYLRPPPSNAPSTQIPAKSTNNTQQNVPATSNSRFGFRAKSNIPSPVLPTQDPNNDVSILYTHVNTKKFHTILTIKLPLLHSSLQSASSLLSIPKKLLASANKINRNSDQVVCKNIHRVMNMITDLIQLVDIEVHLKHIDHSGINTGMNNYIQQLVYLTYLCKYLHEYYAIYILYFSIELGEESEFKNGFHSDKAYYQALQQRVNQKKAVLSVETSIPSILTKPSSSNSIIDSADVSNNGLGFDFKVYYPSMFPIFMLPDQFIEAYPTVLTKIYTGDEKQPQVRKQLVLRQVHHIDYSTGHHDGETAEAEASIGLDYAINVFYCILQHVSQGDSMSSIAHPMRLVKFQNTTPHCPHPVTNQPHLHSHSHSRSAPTVGDSVSRSVCYYSAQLAPDKPVLLSDVIAAHPEDPAIEIDSESYGLLCFMQLLFGGVFATGDNFLVLPKQSEESGNKIVYSFYAMVSSQDFEDCLFYEDNAVAGANLSSDVDSPPQRSFPTHKHPVSLPTCHGPINTFFLCPLFHSPLSPSLVQFLLSLADSPSPEQDPEDTAMSNSMVEVMLITWLRELYTQQVRFEDMLSSGFTVQDMHRLQLPLHLPPHCVRYLRSHLVQTIQYLKDSDTLSGIRYVDLLKELYPNYYVQVYKHYMESQPLDCTDQRPDRTLTVWKAMTLLYEESRYQLDDVPSSKYVQSIEDVTLEFLYDFDYAQYAKYPESGYLFTFLFDSLSYARIMFLRNITVDQVEMLLGGFVVQALTQPNTSPTKQYRKSKQGHNIKPTTLSYKIEQVVIIEEDESNRQELEQSFIVASLKEILQLNVVFLSAEEDQVLAKL